MAALPLCCAPIGSSGALADETPMRQRIALPDTRLTVNGLPWFEEDRPVLRRLPERLKERFRLPVWSLAQDPSGGRIRFRTDSTIVGVVAENPSFSNMHHMTSVGENGFDLYVDRQYVGSAWPDGAGKTTTMRILTCYLPPTEGTARVAGFDVFAQPLEVKKRVGYLPETPPLYPDMSVRDYLDFCSRIKGVAPAERRTRVDDAEEKCRVGNVQGTLIQKLSKDYRQRVGLAQATLLFPVVLILDEPTAGLDPKQIIETRELIRSLAGSHTVVLSTHILPEVSMTCGRVVIIDKGRVVAEDTPENLTRRLKGAGVLRVEARGVEAALVAALRAVPATWLKPISGRALRTGLSFASTSFMQTHFTSSSGARRKLNGDVTCRRDRRFAFASHAASRSSITPMQSRSGSQMLQFDRQVPGPMRSMAMRRAKKQTGSSSSCELPMTFAQ